MDLQNLKEEELSGSVLAHTSNCLTEMRRNVSYNAIITPGEASESEEEEDCEDCEDCEELPPQTFTFSPQNYSRTRKASEMSQSQRSTFSDDNSSISEHKYNSLLHKKLKEKNEQLKKELADIACGPYNNATKEVTNITKQLIQSQKIVQNVSASLRKVSKELRSLEDTIASIKNDKNLLFNDFIFDSNINEPNLSQN